MFNQVDAVITEHFARTQGHGFVPRLIDVNAHTGALAQGLFDRDDVGQVAADFTGANLQFEDTVTAQVEHLFGLGNVLFGVAAGQRPGHRQGVAHAAAEQFADRQVAAFAEGVKQGAFDAGLGKRIAANATLQAQHGSIDIARVLANQQRREVPIDIDLDAVGAFIAVAQAADGGGLADTFNAVGATHADNHQGLVLHRVHRQLVRADGREVDDDGLDRLDGANRHGYTRWVLYRFEPILCRIFAGFQYRMGLAQYLQGMKGAVMELRHLRYFQVLGETLNFTRAAERLHIAQPPLSRQIQQLEDELGVILLERGRPLRLTEAGRFFYEHANVLLEQLGKVCDNTRRIGQGEKTWLGIGFAPSTLYGVLPELIRRLRNHEALELELGLSEMTTLQQVEALKAGRIDVGFGRIRIDDPAIVQRVLVEDRLVAVLPAGPRLLGAPASLAQLAAEPFVLYPGNPRPSYADHVIALFDAHGLSLQVAQWTNELQTAIGLVGAGMGVTLVPASVQVLHRADIGYTPIVETTATSPIILSRRVNDQSPGLSHCLQLVEELI